MANGIIKEAELIRLQMELAQAFNPSGPIGNRDLFSGRIEQIRRVLSAIGQRGQHIVLYGERGVGKTSLASLVHEFWNEAAKDVSNVLTVRYNCGPADTFGSIWANIAESMTDEFEKRGIRIPNGASWESLFAILESREATPNDVRRFLDLSNKTL